MVKQNQPPKHSHINEESENMNGDEYMDDKRRHENDDESNEKRIETVDQLIDHILNMLENSISDDADRPLVQGFTIISQPGKNPTIFGFEGRRAVKPSDEGEKEGDFYILQQDPLIEVQQTGDRVYLLADLGADEDSVEYHSSDMQVEINVMIDGVGYSRLVRLPARVDPDTAISSYRNGVLEIAFEYPHNG
jgi:HSP20 family protein